MISSAAPKLTRFQYFMRHGFAVEAIPIVAIVLGVLSGGTYLTYRAAMGPTIQWTKANPQPWNTIQPNQGTKLLEVNQKFEQKWSRDKL
ncbi:hypothetical protein C8J56DRAFT_979433 [Mycena floridula]|nr:hypothetical protein C8J56DRAFT_844145 [Mycena floridula]KAJ7574346.1 hypothetical protein C8J56DRAFT_979433 [Mycena floridula]